MYYSQGSEGFEAQINKCLENAEYLYDQLQRRTDFKLVFDSKVSETCMRKIPPPSCAMFGFPFIKNYNIHTLHEFVVKYEAIIVFYVHNKSNI